MADSRTPGTVRAFVRRARTILVFQLLAATAALAVTAWAALQVRPLLAERERLAAEILDANADLERVREEVAGLEARAAELRADLQGARAATPILEKAFGAYHAGRYGEAIERYDEAIGKDPRDPYIYNLKSYSQFKLEDYAGAARTLSIALRLDPAYDYGYFDLARYQCAAGAPDAALNTIVEALESRGDGIRGWINYFLREDGEFTTRCAAILDRLADLAAHRDDVDVPGGLE